MAKKKKKSAIDYKDVLAIPFSQVNEFDNGFTYANNKNIYTEFNDGKFISHDGLDKCIEVTQIMPFLMIRNDKNEFLVIKRSDAPINKPSDLYSVGLYDHIYPEDGYSDNLFSSLIRLLHTNIIKYKPLPFKHVGFVKDVGDSHLGIVFVLDTFAFTMEPCNKKYMYQWFTKEQLIDNYSRFKPWSQHIINYIIDDNNEL
jgi:predicted NUDIX family phosphoesterase